MIPLPIDSVIAEALAVLGLVRAGAGREGVEGPDPEAGGVAPQQAADPLLHFAGGLVGEGDGEDPSGGTPCSSISRAIRVVMTRVFPKPAPAKTRSGPLTCSTASRWAGLGEFGVSNT